MYRIVSFVVISSFVLAMLYFHQNNSHYAGADQHVHEGLEIPDGEAVPAVEGDILQDDQGVYMLKIETENFTFAPEKVGSSETTYNEGHAHLYVNGEKTGRIFSEFHDLGELKDGSQITVTLASNDHKLLMNDGEFIHFKEKVGKK